jgi:hypothetical protein
MESEAKAGMGGQIVAIAGVSEGGYIAASLPVAGVSPWEVRVWRVVHLRTRVQIPPPS